MENGCRIGEAAELTALAESGGRRVRRAHDRVVIASRSQRELL